MVREHSKTIGRSKARGSHSTLRVGGSGRVVTEIVLGVRATVGCREGENGRGNRHGDKRKRPRDRQRSVVRRRRDKSSKIANAKVNALRLRELGRRNYFSCARSGIFIGTRGVSFRLLVRDDRSWCESCTSVFLGARDWALSLLEQVSRNECGSCLSGFMGQG